MSCLDNIIYINGVCDAGTSLSGLDLFDAPEINRNTLADIASTTYISGLALAKEKVNLAKILVRNDVMAVLGANNAIPNILDIAHTTSTFKPGTSFPAEAKERGLTVYRNSRIRGSIRKTTIHKIQVYPLNDATNVALKIYDNAGTVSTYNVNLTGNQVNEFDVEYTLQGSFARVVLDGTNVSVSSAYLTCFTGCNGTMPNDCGYTKGWYDGKEISSKEGFGISLVFSCKCDYDELLCGLSKGYLGEIFWLKCRVLILEEHMRSDRFNNWVTYGREETKEWLLDVENQYRSKWNTLVNSLPSLLKNHSDDCIKCNGTKWVTNV